MTSHHPQKTPADGASAAPIALSLEQLNELIAKKPIRNIKPDVLSIDGHQFPINYGVPQDITDRLLGLFTEPSDSGNIKYEDIPEDLKAYEVVSLAGHYFRCNDAVPEDVKERLRELKRLSRAREFKYEEVPEDLKAYHLWDIAVLRGDPQ